MNLDLSFYNWAMVSDYLLKGFIFSLKLTGSTAVFGIMIGTLLALAKLSKHTWLSRPATLYINLMRAIPLVMLILWFYLLVPLMLGRPIGAEPSAYITFTAFEAAFFAEIIRSGIQALPRGQSMAGLALGMSQWQTMRLIVLPQALRHMIPVLLTQVIILFQDTSLVYAIGAYDLLKGFEIVGKNFGRPVEAYLLAAAAYFLICFLLTRSILLVKFRLSVKGLAHD